MTKEKTQMWAGLIGWLVVGWLLTLAVAFMWLLTDTVTAVVLALGIGLGIGIAFIIMINETLILAALQALRSAGESVVRMLSLRKYMRAVLAVWILGLFTLVVVMTVFNQLDLDRFNAILGVLGSFVASVIAYYFAAGRGEPSP
ncbi:MAG: hypothetical protein ACE5H4_11715 [Candidatus Thorarchaeota archaeon]